MRLLETSLLASVIAISPAVYYTKRKMFSVPVPYYRALGKLYHFNSLVTNLAFLRAPPQVTHLERNGQNGPHPLYYYVWIKGLSHILIRTHLFTLLFVNKLAFGCQYYYIGI